MREDHLKPISAFWLYALAYFALLFHPNMVCYDDFSYFQSVTETVARSALCPDWLERYIATLSSISALAYLASGSVPFST